MIKNMNKISIVGAVGIPARYGGFETLAENLAAFHNKHKTPCELAVYCTSKGSVDKPALLKGGALTRTARMRASGKKKATIQALISAEVRLIMSRSADDLGTALEQAANVIDHHLQHPGSGQN